MEGRTATSFALEFEGANDVEPVGHHQLDHQVNYLIGSVPSSWRRGISSYSEVRYDDIYAGVDLRFYFMDGLFKYDFILDAGVDPDVIILRYTNVEGLELDTSTGDMIISTDMGSLKDSRPIINQVTSGRRAEMIGDFTLRESHSFSFHVPEDCSRSLPMVIDPGIEFSTYLGGSGNDMTFQLDIDDSGNIYVVGMVLSLDFPTTQGVIDEKGNVARTGYEDAVVAKLDPTCSDLLFATYLGGSTDDMAVDIEVGPEGDLLIVGGTTSTDFPTTTDAPYPTHPGSLSGYFLELSGDGSQVLYGTFLGGGWGDAATNLALDDAGNIFITGYTSSPDFPTTPGAFCTTLAPDPVGFIGDVFAIKMDPTFSWVYSTYFGGSGYDHDGDICIDGTGSLIIVGITRSDPFCVSPGEFSTKYSGGEGDGFIIMLSPDGSSVEKWTYLGGRMEDRINSVEIGPNGTIYVAGVTMSPDFPITEGAIKSNNQGDWDGFLGAFDDDLENLRFCSYFGGSKDEWVHDGLAIDNESGVIYLSGRTTSLDLNTTIGCYDTSYRGIYPSFRADAFLASFNLSDHSLKYSTYLGGTLYDSVPDIEIDNNGSLYLLIHTASADFPITPNAYCSTSIGGFTDFLIVKFDPNPSLRPEAPIILSVETGDKYVTLRWDVPIQFNYRMQKHIVYKGESAASMKLLTELDGTANTITDRDVINGVWYYFSVTAVNSAGEGNRSTVKARPLTLPSAPRELTAVTGDGTINLTWNVPMDTGGEILGYRIIRGKTLDAMDEVQSNCTSTHYVDDEIQTGCNYYYSIRAFNSLGNGPMSELVSIRATAPPSPPSDFWVSPDDTCVHLHWGPPLDNGGSDIVGFRVYRGTSPRKFVLWREYPSQTFSHRDFGCLNGKRYYYHVTSFSAVGESAPSATRMAIPFGVPTAPRFLVAEAGDGQVSLSWSEPIDDNGRPITGYKVYCGESPDSLYFSTIIGNRTSYLHTAATNGIMYFYEVSAINEAGEGILRSETADAMPMGLPGRPSDLATGSVLDSITLSWRPPADAGGVDILAYRIFRGPSQEAQEPIETVEDCEEYYDEDVVAGRVYYYSVAAVNMLGEGSPSKTVTGVLLTEPGPVHGLSLSVGDGYIELVWSPPEIDGGSPVRGYNVYKGTRETSLHLFVSLLSLTNFNDTEVENGNTYFYMVQAENDVGPGPLSSVVDGTPLGRPGRVGMFQAIAEADGVLLSWGEPTGTGCVPVSGYVVMRGLNPGELTPIIILEDSMTFKDTEVESGREYYYCVAANSSLGMGPASQIVEVEIEPTESRTNTSRGYLMIPILLVCAMVAVYAWRRRPRDRDLAMDEEILQDVKAGEDVVVGAASSDIPMDDGTPSYIVEKVFLVYHDGRPIVKATRQEYTASDADLMSGLLIAVQSIVQYGLESGSTLKSIKYGENLILVTGGSHINLATVIYGKPTDTLIADLEDTVGQIEAHYSDILDTWSGDPAEFLGAMGLIAPLIESTKDMRREDVAATTAAQDVSLLSAIDFYRGYVRLKVAALNTTDEQIVDAAIEIRYDPDMLRIDHVEPSRFRLKGDRVLIGRIEPGKSRSVAILLDPQICQGTHVDGTFTYYDVNGEYHRLDMKRCHAEVVCPIFFTRKNANTAMLRRLIKERLRVTEFRIFRYPRTMAPSEVLNVGRNAIGGSDVQLVREYIVGGPPYEAEVWYYGETKVKNYKIVMRLGVIEDKHAVEFFAASTAMEPITGLLAEFRRNLNQLMREKYSEGFTLEPERDEQIRKDLKTRELLIDNEELQEPEET
jgi:fibronectin type 3 domain-containing protein